MALIRAARQEKVISFPCRWILEELVNNDNKKQQSNRSTNKYMKKKSHNCHFGQFSITFIFSGPWTVY